MSSVKDAMHRQDMPDRTQQLCTAAFHGDRLLSSSSHLDSVYWARVACCMFGVIFPHSMGGIVLFLVKLVVCKQ